LERVFFFYETLTIICHIANCYNPKKPQSLSKKLITTVNIGIKVTQVKCNLTRSNDNFNIAPVLKHHEEVKIHGFNLGYLEPFTSL